MVLVLRRLWAFGIVVFARGPQGVRLSGRRGITTSMRGSLPNCSGIYSRGLCVEACAPRLCKQGMAVVGLPYKGN